MRQIVCTTLFGHHVTGSIVAHVGASVVHRGKTLVGGDVGVNVSEDVVGDNVSHVPHN